MSLNIIILLLFNQDVEYVFCVLSRRSTYIYYIYLIKCDDRHSTIRKAIGKGVNYILFYSTLFLYINIYLLLLKSIKHPLLKMCHHLKCVVHTKWRE